MKKGICLLLLIYPAWASSETVERIVAAVNGEIILLSDLKRDEFWEGRKIPLEARVQERVDYQLLLSEAKRFVVDPPSQEEMGRAMDTLVRRFRNKPEFQAKLREVGMTQDELREMISDRLLVKTFLEDRIGFFIFVSDEEVAQYIREHPEAWTGIPENKRDDQIQALLKAEKEQAKTQEYLELLRSRAKIQIYRR